MGTSLLYYTTARELIVLSFPGDYRIFFPGADYFHLEYLMQLIALIRHETKSGRSFAAELRGKKIGISVQTLISIFSRILRSFTSRKENHIMKSLSMKRRWVLHEVRSASLGWCTQCDRRENRFSVHETRTPLKIYLIFIRRIIEPTLIGCLFNLAPKQVVSGPVPVQTIQPYKLIDNFISRCWW